MGKIDEAIWWESPTFGLEYATHRDISADEGGIIKAFRCAFCKVELPIQQNIGATDEKGRPIVVPYCDNDSCKTLLIVSQKADKNRL